MWSRSELKAIGKSKFKANYWNCVIVEIILGVLLAAQVTSSRSGDQQSLEETLQSFSPTILLGGISIAFVIGMLIQIFVKNPLIVGGHRFFLENSYDNSVGVSRMISIYREGDIFNIFITMFLKNLFLVLWSFLFVIPGIVKAYSYRMVPFILAENPHMEWKEVITRSRQMMRGQKMNAFMLDLSFIGWMFLSALTGGILGVLYTNPYMRATNTELYKRIR